MSKKKIDHLADLKKDVLKRSFRVKRLKDIKVIAGCLDSKNPARCAIKCNCPEKTEEELEKYYIDPLKTALKKLGKLGEKPNKTRNYLGNCAEQRACNTILTQDMRHPIPLKRINYTRAYRVRTAQVKDYCENCIDVLGVSN